MATKTLTSRIILRNDTATNWTASDPTLLKGEIGLERDTNRYKIGDGTSSWSALDYYSNLTDERSESLDTLIEMMQGDEFGKVDDVQVNGSSVVTDKIASVTIGTLTTSTASQSSGDTESFTDSIVLHKVAKTGEYTDLLNAPSVINSLDSVSTTDALSAYQGSVLQSMVQNIETAKVYENISTLVTSLNTLSSSELHVGENLFVQALNVPDFWVVSIESSSSTYSYTTDDAFVEDIQTNTSVQVGYYKISLLETAKVDLTDYYTSAQVDSLLSGYVTSTVFTTTLADYVTSSSLTTTLGDYVTSSTLTTTLEDYYTKTEVDTSLEDYIKSTDTLILNGGSSEV